MKPTLPALKVAPCPIHKGKHPYHDARYITTADFEAEALDNDNWDTIAGSVIATMTDHEDQKQLANLFAAAPILLSELIKARTELAQWHFHSVTTRPGYYNSDGWKVTQTVLNSGRSVIQQCGIETP